MQFWICGLLVAAFTIGAIGEAAAKEKEPFNSKIGIHLIGAYSPGSKKMVAARCPVLKILDLTPEMVQAARDYKKHNPDGIVVLRCFWNVNGDFQRFTLQDDPVEKARWFWDHIVWERWMSKISPEDRKLIDYVQSTNEYGECPTFEDDASIAWFVKFSNEFTKKCVAAGFKPCHANIPVGNPGGDADEIMRKILLYAPALREAKKVGGVWSYHAYTIEYTTDPKVEAFYSLRYRKFYDAFTGEYADLKDMPMIITEAGVDRGGNADKDGWAARGDAAKFQNFLTWWDKELQKDSYIKGATLFQNGSKAGWGGWASFELEPLADWFVQYWGGKPALRFGK